MLITELVRRFGDRLTATDRRLASALHARPAEAAFWSAAQLTEPLGLHQSAATRMAQRLGFDGYPRLRDALRHDYLAGGGPSQRVRGRLERHDEVLSGLVEDEARALSEIPQHVTQDDLDDLATRIIEAPAVHLFGTGNATALVAMLDRRLHRYGVRTVTITGSARDAAEQAATMTPGDVLLATAFRRVPALLAPLIETAREVGAHSALLTDTLLTLTPQPDRIVAAPRGGSDDFLTLTVPMAIANALVLTIARREPERAIGSLDRLGTLLERFDT